MNTFFLLSGNILQYLSFVWLFKYTKSTKKRSSVQLSIKKGFVCQNCKEDIEVKPEEYINRLQNQKGSYITLCTPCKRNQSLNNLLEEKISLEIFKIYLYKKWKFYYFVIFVLLSLTFNITNIYTKIDFFGFCGGLTMFISQMINYYVFINNSRLKKD